MDVGGSEPSEVDRPLQGGDQDVFAVGCFDAGELVEFAGKRDYP